MLQTGEVSLWYLLVCLPHSLNLYLKCMNTYFSKSFRKMRFFSYSFYSCLYFEGFYCGLCSYIIHSLIYRTFCSFFNVFWQYFLISCYSCVNVLDFYIITLPVSSSSSAFFKLKKSLMLKMSPLDGNGINPINWSLL